MLLSSIITVVVLSAVAIVQAFWKLCNSITGGNMGATSAVGVKVRDYL